MKCIWINQWAHSVSWLNTLPYHTVTNANISFQRNVSVRIGKREIAEDTEKRKKVLYNFFFLLDKRFIAALVLKCFNIMNRYHGVDIMIKLVWHLFYCIQYIFSYLNSYCCNTNFLCIVSISVPYKYSFPYSYFYVAAIAYVYSPCTIMFLIQCC